jgi:hypothetical protein
MANELAGLGWHSFVKQLQYPSSLNQHLDKLPHPSAPYLHRLARHGVPAPSSSPTWLPQCRHQAFTRGPHPSASRLYSRFLLEDMWDYVQMGYWTVLPFHAVQHLPHLKLAPAGVVPQRERRPRPIMDYTFNSVNQHSLPLAPTHAMQFGTALKRILQRLVYANPAFGAPLLMKVDLADGYYRIPLSPEAALELAVVLPPDHDGENLIGFPLSLPMGWRSSPPFFCAFTETGADLANFYRTSPLPEHPLETVAQTTPFPTYHQYSPTAVLPPQFEPPPNPLSYVDVYIDDFIAAAQWPTATATSRALFHAIDSIFVDHPESVRRQVVSSSKLAKGDAAWSHQQRILGWDVNTTTMTLHLPPHRADRLLQLLKAFLDRKRTSRQRWHRLLGELRSMAAALHSTQYLFSILQHVLVDQQATRIRINQLVRQALRDWLTIAQDMATHPVPLAHLVPRAPTFLGATDASKSGMGGFWAPTMIHPQCNPILWRAPFPMAIQRALATASNPTGPLTNSDLELAALVTGAQVAATYSNTTPTTLVCATDNTPALAWTSKGSTSSIQAPAFLLRQLGQISRRYNVTLQPLFTPGVSNTIADFCSRSFHLPDDAFLSTAQRLFPIQPSWTLARPSNDLISQTNFSLSRRMQPWESRPPVLPPSTPPGPYGRPFVPPSTKTHTSTLMTPSRSFACSLAATGLEPLLPVVLQSVLEQWRAPFVPLDRRWPHWDAQTLVSYPPGN